MSAGPISYGKKNVPKDLVHYEEGVTNVNFHDNSFEKDWKDPNSENYQNLVNFINILAIC